MIINQLTNPSPMDKCAMLTKLNTNLVSIPQPGYEREFCYCCYECNVCNSVVFGGSAVEANNDKSSFLFQKQLIGDTISIKLYKDAAFLTDLNSNALGQFFNGIGANGLLVGYVLDWNLVFGAYGVGTYYVETEYTIIGVSGTYTSQDFNLLPYSEEQANGTIRIEWTQNGTIQSNPIDFTGLNWYQSVRLRGSIVTLQPELIQENYTTTDRRTTQIQSQIVEKWRLSTELICKELKDLIYCDLVLANSIKISNFNLFQELLIQKEVNVESLEELKVFQGNRNFAIAINFEDRVKNKLKRNC